MSWWGRVVGGTFGFMLGGPLGALMGASLGNYFDSGLNNLDQSSALNRGEPERVQMAFFTTTFALIGYVAKADGRVTRDEISLAERVMDQMQLSSQQRKAAIDLFHLGKADDFAADEVIAQFRLEVGRRRNLVRMLVSILASTAYADGNFDSRELTRLEQICDLLGVDKIQLRELLEQIAAQSGLDSPRDSKDRLDAAFALLGLSPDASFPEVKKSYRRLMNQNHPDKLVAKGLPEEMIELATAKTRDIKAAYELIKLQA